MENNIKNRTKIVIFNESFLPMSQTFVYKQILGLSEKYEVLLIGSKQENTDFFKLKNKTLIYRKYYGLLDRIILKIYRDLFKDNYRLSPNTVRKIKNFLKSEKVRFIHAHFGPVALKILPIAKALNIPLLVTFHGIDATEVFLKDNIYKYKLKELYSYCEKIFIVSNHMIEPLGLKTWMGKVAWVPCGIDNQEFKRPTEVSHDSSIIRIIHVGRLVPKKGAIDLIKVFLKLWEEYKNIHLDVVGDGPELEICKELTKNLNNNQPPVKIWGALGREQVKELLMQANIYVLNSRTGPDGDMEGVPNGVLEAMSMELPVVSTYHAGIPEVITSGVNGLLVKERDNKSLKEALEKLIKDNNLRKFLGVGGRLRIEERFSLKRTVEDIDNVISEIES
ncbi:Glycosyltransferase involved in cell wall bisynthesis [bacterium A37T11]|nr:Glycosyltransferase involved in cell wall bisynthesis [bacterium A37T11]